MFLGCSPFCDPCQVDWSGVDSVSVTLRTNGDYIKNSKAVVLFIESTGSAAGREHRYSFIDFLGALNGTHVLTRTQHNVQLDSVFGVPRIGSVWSISLDNYSGCAPLSVELQIAHTLGAFPIPSSRVVAALFLSLSSFTAQSVKKGPLDTTSIYKDCVADAVYYNDPSEACALGTGGDVCNSYTLSSGRGRYLTIECNSSQFTAGNIVFSPYQGQNLLFDVVFGCPEEEGCDPDLGEVLKPNGDRLLVVEQISLTSPAIDFVYA